MDPLRPDGPPDQTPPPDPRRPSGSRNRNGGGNFASYYQIAGIGFEFIAAVLILGGIGWFVDGRAGTGPWGLIVGIGAGFALGLWMMVKAAGCFFH
jgi:F0F1-type ATP synthase assembly protein I